MLFKTDYTELFTKDIQAKLRWISQHYNFKNSMQVQITPAAKQMNYIR